MVFLGSGFFLIIIIVLLGAVGVAHTLLAAMTAIFSAINLFAYPIVTFIWCFMRLKKAFGRYGTREELANCAYIPIYLVVGIIAPEFFYACAVFIFSDYIDIAQIIGIIFGLLFMGFLIWIEKYLTKHHVKKGVLISAILAMGIILVSTQVSYTFFKYEMKGQVSNSEIYTVDSNYRPIVFVFRKYRSDMFMNGGANLPYGRFLYDKPYPLAKFKQNTEVVGVTDENGKLKDIHFKSKRYILVYDLENNIVGYVPESLLTRVD